MSLCLTLDPLQVGIVLWEEDWGFGARKLEDFGLMPGGGNQGSEHRGLGFRL